MNNENLTPDESLALNGESFHWAKRFLGQKMGSEAAKLYAFCRLLDDMADGDIENGPQRLINIRDFIGLGGVTLAISLLSVIALLYWCLPKHRRKIRL